MPSNKQTLKELFADDPEMLKMLELREQTGLLRQLSEKNQEGPLEALKLMELREQTSHLKEIAAIKEAHKGDKGEDGKDGRDGRDGRDGVDGMDGEDGINGKDGLDGRDGKDGKDGIDGKDGTSISPEEAKIMLSQLLTDLDISEMGAMSEEEVDKKLKKHAQSLTATFNSRISNLRDTVERNYGGHGGSGGGSPSMVYDLSSQLDGVKTSFTIPANTAIIGVFGSSAPFIFAPTTDYTGTGTTTLSFTSGVDPSSALAAGQTLIVQYY